MFVTNFEVKSLLHSYNKSSVALTDHLSSYSNVLQVCTLKQEQSRSVHCQLCYITADTASQFEVSTVISNKLLTTLVNDKLGLQRQYYCSIVLIAFTQHSEVQI